ncbi:hypothetical protein EDC01DRAFT_781511 [Geopyxis carbonaria]|nr:hypothetical protein EDC01DRAFT_781511 [Geopyxis carbonaria]
MDPPHGEVVPDRYETQGTRVLRPRKRKHRDEHILPSNSTVKQIRRLDSTTSRTTRSKTGSNYVKKTMASYETTTSGLTKVKSSPAEEPTLSEPSDESANIEYSTGLNKVASVNLDLMCLEDKVKHREHELKTLNDRHRALDDKVQTLKTDKTALLDSIHELRTEKTTLDNSVAQTRELQRRFAEIHQAQLGSRWQEDRVFQQRRQAQEAQLESREQAVAAAEARSTKRQEAIDAAKADLKKTKKEAKADLKKREKAVAKKEASVSYSTERIFAPLLGQTRVMPRLTPRDVSRTSAVWPRPEHGLLP